MNRTRQPSSDMPEGNSSAELTAEREFAKRELAETLQTLRQRTNVPERSKQVMRQYFDRGDHRDAHGLSATGSAVGLLCAVAATVVVINYLRNHRR